MSTGKTGDEAFAILREVSQRRNRKIRDIAADLVADAERRARADD
jgi:AmiR/NasT family two-component response regulator